jgi:hypothetical protein
MVIHLLALLVAAGVSDVDKAERLFAKARYEKALAELGPTCDGTADPIACERLRGFILAGLGREDEAQAAFHRMLAIDSDATVGQDVSPRLRRMFGDAKRAVVATQGLELEPIELETGEMAWPLKAYDPEAAELASVVAYVAPPGRERFIRAELAKQEEAWVAELAVPDADAGTARYYMVATLMSGVEVDVGSEQQPRDVYVRVLGFAQKEGSGGAGSGLLDDGVIGAQSASSGGMPSWAVWSIVGGVAVVAAVGVTLAVVLSSRDHEPGTIVVGISFEDDP